MSNTCLSDQIATDIVHPVFEKKLTENTIVAENRGLQKLLKAPVQCVCLFLANDVTSSALLAALMKNKVNVYLAKSDDSDSTTVPSFCSHILTQKKEVGRIELINKKNTKSVVSTYLLGTSGKVIVSSSGTTGAPKYILHGAEKLHANASLVIKRVGITTSARVLIPVPISHMFGLGVGLLPAMVAGSSVMLIKKNNVIKLLEALNTFRPSLVLVTPAVCKMLLVVKKRVSLTTTYVTAGDTISESIYREFESKYGQLVNLYGSSEMGAIATSMRQDDGQRWGGYLKPLAGVRIRCAQERQVIGCQHPAGFEGYLDGVGNLSTTHTPKQWFSTGDRGEFYGSGQFKVLGRNDHLINRFGFLVSTEVIASKLEELFRGFGVVVLISECETISGRLVIAVFESPNSSDIDITEVRRVCQVQLARAFRPDEIRVLPTFPYLSSGKIDRLKILQQIDH